MQILDVISEALASFNAKLGGFLLMGLLVPTGLYLTIYFRLLQVRKFTHALRCVFGRTDQSKDIGDVSPFRALTTALSGTVGIGNIAGVALAIYYGGPGAVFWMWVTGFLGMMTKFSECALGVKYRQLLADGTSSGGPMYYLENGLKRFLGGGAKGLGVFFAIACVLCSFGTGNMAQSNSVSAALMAAYGLPTWITGLVMSVFLMLVIMGGISRIAQVTSRLVPFMALFYMACALMVMLGNMSLIVPSLALIVKSAFTPVAATGGFLGSTFMMAARYGIARGLFSNEAGQGSAAIAHAAAKTQYPIRQGLIAALGPCIDTLLICTMTALTIIVSGAWKSGAQGAPMTALAFETGLESVHLAMLGQHVVSIGVLLFGVSTAISWSYYGDRSIVYLVGERWLGAYRTLYCLLHFAGAVWALELVWNFSDVMMTLMTLPNLVAIILLSRELGRDTVAYFRTQGFQASTGNQSTHI